MNAAQRRDTIVSLLEEHTAPLSATALAQTCGVSRQIIVGDIALLRAGGIDISATARGYLLNRSGGFRRRIACLHRAEDCAVELSTIVDCGCTAVDVTVAHPVYGEITASLQLSSRYDVEQFLAHMARAKAQPLSSLTNGVHLHTVLCPDEERFSLLCQQLTTLGILLRDEEQD